MIIKRIIIPFAILLCIWGCATAPEKGPRFSGLPEMRPGYSLVYFYRPHEYIGRWVWPDIFMNHTKVAGLLDQTFAVIHTKPGKYRISTKKSLAISGIPEVEYELTVESGLVYYLHYDRKYVKTGIMADDYKLVYARWTLTDANEAMSEIRRLQHVTPYIDTVQP